MSNDINDGGPAFARTLGESEREEHAFAGRGPAPYAQNGMTLRDYFAAKAMQGFAADPRVNGTAEDVADLAYRWADAMLKARES